MDSVLELQTHGKLLEEAPSEATLAAIVMESNVSTGKLQKSQTEEVPMAGMPLMASCVGRVLELVLGLDGRESSPADFFQSFLSRGSTKASILI